MRDEHDHDERKDRDDLDRRSAPPYPALLSIAGWMWVVLGALFLPLTVFGATRIDYSSSDAGARLGSLAFPLLLAVAFIRAGVQTIKGTADGTGGNATLSLVVSIATLSLTAWRVFIMGNWASLIYESIAVMSFLIPGVIAIRSRAEYIDWKAFHRREIRSPRHIEKDDIQKR